ncbi:hypothetical protein ANN_21117 [Periplaneta americana]|uniref:Odorant receptor n=1 Tax=Periplaneta americana TaxID=6978 RepID=A0ABQ8SFM5_PERAM|nr:hypothetical protein ANN_21117 [Periplaneta americana]
MHIYCVLSFVTVYTRLWLYTVLVINDNELLQVKPLPSYSSVDFDFLSINVKVLHLVGLWNHHWQHKNRWRYWAYLAYAVFMIVIMMIHFVTEVLELIFTWGDFTTFASTAWFANNYGASIIKQIFILAQTDRVQDTTMKLRGGVLSRGLRWSQEQDEIARSTNRQVRYLSIGYYAVAVSSCLGLFAIAIRTSYSQLYEAFTGAANFTEHAGSMDLPLKAWFPYDVQQPMNYLWTFGFQLIIVAVGPMINIGTDTFITGLIIHACGELRILKKSIRNLEQRALQLLLEDRKPQVGQKMKLSKLPLLEDVNPVSERIRNDNSGIQERLGNDRMPIYTKAELQPKLYHALVECTQHHQQVLMFVSELENMFSSMMFIQFLSISVRICLIIFHITTASICLNIAYCTSHYKLNNWCHTDYKYFLAVCFKRITVQFFIMLPIIFLIVGIVYRVISDDRGLVQVTYIQILCVSFLQGLPFCLYGSELTWQSECVGRVLYETPWVENTLRFRRSLVVMVTRAQTTLQLTGGKIYVMSLETFQTVSLSLNFNVAFCYYLL